LVRATAAAVAWAGEAGVAARLAAALVPGSPDAALHRAAADFRAGRREEGLGALRTLAAGHASGSAFLEGYLLGAASLEAGRPGDAARALRGFQRMNVPLAWMWAHARSLLLLARAEEALGRRGEARAVADRLARYWADAEPEDPLTMELRDLRERLRR
jgi:hypothetical protein